MISHPQTEPDKQKPDGRKQRYAFLAVCCIPAIVGLVFVLYGELKRKQARASLDWPVAAGRIVTSKVTSSTSEGDTTYSADIEYVYTVEGVEHNGDVVVIGGHEYALHSVVARYPTVRAVREQRMRGRPSEEGGFAAVVWGVRGDFAVERDDLESGRPVTRRVFEFGRGRGVV